ncbi:hypothetical protein NFI96_021682 [Prochilodus magdalenae]|nr:hypothetical protein NFI96_021682 [Prochilodus magdalenae]
MDQGYTTPFTITPFLGKTPYRPAPFSIGLFQLRFHPGFPLWRVNSWTLPFGSKEETAYTFPKSFFQILLRGREGAFGMFGYGTAPYILQSVQIECSERGKVSPHVGELSGDGESLCDSNSTVMESDTEDS